MKLRSTLCIALLLATAASASELTTSIRQVTFGPQHHFYGYIGHVGNVPWNASGRYIVALRTGFQDRMPQAGEPADIVLLDTHNDYAVRGVEQSRAWNFQQGTMLYWNPQQPETQFFFNDRDPVTQNVFCVLYDIAAGRRVAEYRFDDTPVGNSGVAQQGGWFSAINYGRLARLRPVTGYPDAHDWTTGVKHPSDDGVWQIDVASGQKRLLISFAQLADLLRPTHPEVADKELFINHTLSSRDGRHIFLFVRGDFEQPDRFNVPMVMQSDGTRVRPLAMFIGGHPEWMPGTQMVGSDDQRQILFDVEEQQIVGTLGTPELFPKPGGDVALSPNGQWFVNGHGVQGKNFYTILRLADNASTRTAGINQGGYTEGELRIDPAPCWNRDNNQLLVPGMADDGTRQMFLITVQEKGASE